MSRTVCSWCKAPLVLKDDILVCSNTDCPACDEKYLHEALNCTRKALDVAVNALNKIANTDIKVIEKEPLYYARAMFWVTNNALGCIQDIKQKDVK